MKIADLKEKLAITMWDSSWLRRRYAGGGFESFDQALDELKDRGYNAVRIDAYPHMIANAPDGTNVERFLDTPGVSHHKYGFAQWGSQWTVYIHPRNDILEFIRKAKERGIYVALSTWLKPTWECRNDFLEGPEDIIRIWDETLGFLQENGCLDNIVYVDVQNEIPNGACNTWLSNQLSCLKNPVVIGKMNARQKDFYRSYFVKIIRELKRRWPQLSFTASYSDMFEDDALEADLSDYDLLDAHYWAEYAPCAFVENTGYHEYLVRFGDPDRIYLNGSATGYTGTVRRTPGDFHFEELNRKIQKAWQDHKSELTDWLESRIEFAAGIGRKYGIPVGNTEGWGSVFWVDHPSLEWTHIKEAALIAAKLGVKYGYAFNCQSNFCEPQFLHLWRDIDHHREVTNIIKNGRNQE